MMMMIIIISKNYYYYYCCIPFIVHLMIVIVFFKHLSFARKFEGHSPQTLTCRCAGDHNRSCCEAVWFWLVAAT